MPVHDKSKCLYCGGCSGACPENVITVLEDSLEIDLKNCTKCNICVKVCPAGAMVKE